MWSTVKLMYMHELRKLKNGDSENIEGNPALTTWALTIGSSNTLPLPTKLRGGQCVNSDCCVLLTGVPSALSDMPGRQPVHSDGEYQRCHFWSSLEMQSVTTTLPACQYVFITTKFGL